MTQSIESIQLVRSASTPWSPLNEPGISGISVKVLRHDPQANRAPTILLKFEPGASYPAHDHPAGEEAFVLEGEIHFGPHHLKSGDYLYTPPSGKHSVWTETGCTLLLSVPEAVVILTKR